MNDHAATETLKAAPAVGAQVQLDRDSFSPLVPCPMCGGKPYAYDLRETHVLCTVECGSCDHEVQADTPDAAAARWNTARA